MGKQKDSDGILNDRGYYLSQVDLERSVLTFFHLSDKDPMFTARYVEDENEVYIQGRTKWVSTKDIHKLQRGF